MNVTKKHREIADEVLDAVKAQFPSVCFLSMGLSPESDNDIWIDVSVPDDEMVYPVIQFASPIIVDFLIETGYKVTILPEVRKPVEA